MLFLKNIKILIAKLPHKKKVFSFSYSTVFFQAGWTFYKTPCIIVRLKLPRLFYNIGNLHFQLGFSSHHYIKCDKLFTLIKFEELLLIGK